MNKKKIVVIAIAAVIILWFVTLPIDWEMIELGDKYPNPFMDSNGQMCDRSQIKTSGGGNIFTCDYSKTVRP